MVKIEEKLDNINKTLEKMLDVMEKPEHPIKNILTIAGLIASIFVIVEAIDTIISWLKEGIW